MLAEPSTPQRGRGTGEAIQVPNWNPGGGYAFSALLAIGIHAGMLFCLPKGRLFEPAEYGVVQGERATEVTLVAPSRISEDPVAESSEATQSSKVTESSEAMDEPKEEPVPDEVASEIRTLQEMRKPEQMQDAKPPATPTGSRVLPSSKVQAKPATRKDASSGGRNPARSGSRSSSIDTTSGSLTSKPAYLHNPHPAYPEISRKARPRG